MNEGKIQIIPAQDLAESSRRMKIAMKIAEKEYRKNEAHAIRAARNLILNS